MAAVGTAVVLYAQQSVGTGKCFLGFGQTFANVDFRLTIFETKTPTLPFTNFNLQFP